MKICPNCNKERVTDVKGDGPYAPDHLQCGSCDSTFTQQGYDKMKTNLTQQQWQQQR